MWVCVRECESVLGYIQSFGVSVFLRFHLSPFLLFPQSLCAVALVRVDVDNHWSQSGSGCDSHLGSTSILRERRSPHWLNRETIGASVVAVVCPAGTYLLIGRLLLFEVMPWRVFLCSSFVYCIAASFFFFVIVVTCTVTSLQAVHNWARKTIKWLNRELNKWELCTYC